MFTGIVQTRGTIVSAKSAEGFRTLGVSVEADCLKHLNLGASIAINGVCLTVTRFETAHNDVVGTVYFDVINETLRVTNLSTLKQGDLVNFERSVSFGTEIGGHLVSGHVHGCALVEQIIQTENNYSLRLSITADLIKYIFAKGFVAVDGASLTVGEVLADGFVIHLIPETLRVTNLGMREVNDRVNIELDQQTFSIVKTVERVLAQQKSLNF